MFSKMFLAGLLLTVALLRVPAFAGTVEVDFSGVITNAAFGIPGGAVFTGSAFYTELDTPAYSWPCNSGACTASYAIPESFTFSVDGSSVDSTDFALNNSDIYVQNDQTGPFPDQISWIFSSNLAANGPLSSALGGPSPLFTINFEGPSSVLGSFQIPTAFPTLSQWSGQQLPSPNIELITNDGTLIGTITGLSSTVVTPEPADLWLLLVASFGIAVRARRSPGC